MKILTSYQMGIAESAAVTDGTDYSRLMENAGSACAKAIRDEYNLNENNRKKVTVICGRGNNGGDGYVVARKLFEAGCRVAIVVIGGMPTTDQAKEMFERVEKMPINMALFDANKKTALEAIMNTDIIVEAVFGIGLQREVTGLYEELFRCINSSPAQIVSIDVPGGVETDSGKIMGYSVKADFTVAICCAKPCHIYSPGKELCGKIKVVNIGITDDEINSIGAGYCNSVDFDDIANKIIPRKFDANKGNFGHVLSVCGSRNMPGAAVFAGKGAVLTGAGLVTCAFPKSAYPAVASKLTCPLMLPLKENEEGTLSSECIDDILEKAEKCNVILIGCGLGKNIDTAKVLVEVIRNAKVPVIIDADGINIISSNINVLKAANVPIILTPHPGEMSRLTGKSISQIQSDRIQTAVKFAEENNVTLVLKGANTVIALPNEETAYVNTTGNPGMAKGGSGDLLAGMIAGFTASGMSVADATLSGVYVHGMAGDIAAEKKSQIAMTPSDVADCLPFALSTLEKSKIMLLKLGV